MNDNFRRIVRYLIIMLAVFLLVCIIGIIKNWSVLATAIGNSFSSLLLIVIYAVAIIYIILLVFRR